MFNPEIDYQAKKYRPLLTLNNPKILYIKRINNQLSFGTWEKTYGFYIKQKNIGTPTIKIIDADIFNKASRTNKLDSIQISLHSNTIIRNAPPRNYIPITPIKQQPYEPYIKTRQYRLGELTPNHAEDSTRQLKLAIPDHRLSRAIQKIGEICMSTDGKYVILENKHVKLWWKMEIIEEYRSIAKEYKLFMDQYDAEKVILENQRDSIVEQIRSRYGYTDEEIKGL